MTHTGHVNWRRWAEDARQHQTDGQVNGRPAETWETEVLNRAREAARVQETAGLLNGVNPVKSNEIGA